MAVGRTSVASAIWTHGLSRFLVGALWLAALGVSLISVAGVPWVGVRNGIATYLLIGQGIGFLTGALMIVAASILRLKRFHEPISALFSFTFLALANVSSRDIWIEFGWYESDQVFGTVWLVLLLMAIPALPSGRYEPRWLVWSLLVAPVAGWLIAPIMGLSPIGPNLLPEQFETARAVLLVAAIGCVFLRFRYTPKGPERQQLKWASLGLSGGMILYAAALAIFMVQYVGLWGSHPFMVAAYEPLQHAQRGLTSLGFVVMAAGVLTCLMDYRLNDADAAIGRSTGYTIVTALLAATWAMGSIWINEGLLRVVGDGNAGLATMISAVLMVLIVNPVKTRVLRWTEDMFQRALVRLRELPARLVRWQHEDDPRRVARATLVEIIEGVSAQYGAVVAYDADGRPWVIAAQDVDEEPVLQAVDDPSPVGFAQKVSLDDGPDHIGWLLVGPRTDGARYSFDERAAIQMIVDPLADAIRHTARRDRLNAVLMRSIAAMEGMEVRLSRIEASR